MLSNDKISYGTRHQNNRKTADFWVVGGLGRKLILVVVFAALFLFTVNQLVKNEAFTSADTSGKNGTAGTPGKTGTAGDDRGTTAGARAGQSGAPEETGGTRANPGDDRGTTAGARAGQSGAPDELRGSGGAWDGSAIRTPYLSVSYDASEETEFCLYKEYLAECSKDSFCLLDENGFEVFQINIDFQKPAMFKRGDFLLVCDINGRSAFLMKGKKLIWEDTFTNGIVNAHINRDGYISFVLEAVGYRNIVRVIAPIGKALFDWVVADDFVVCSEVSPTGKELYINRLRTAGINVSSVLEFLDMKPEPFQTIESRDESLFLSASYLGDNTIATATEFAFQLYSTERKPIYGEMFDSIMSMCEFPQNKVVLAAQQGNQALLVEYDPKALATTADSDAAADIFGKKVLFETDRPIRNMSAEDSSLFINLVGEVYVLRDTGKPELRLVLDSEALYGGVSDKLGILVVTKKSADIYSK